MVQVSLSYSGKHDILYNNKLTVLGVCRQAIPQELEKVVTRFGAENLMMRFVLR
jgi:hypothetical protein